MLLGAVGLVRDARHGSARAPPAPALELLSYKDFSEWAEKCLVPEQVQVCDIKESSLVGASVRAEWKFIAAAVCRTHK